MPTTIPLPEAVTPAGFWRRAIASLIDAPFILIPTWIVVALLYHWMFDPKTGQGLAEMTETEAMERLQAINLHKQKGQQILPFILTFCSWIVNWIYFALMESSRFQGSLGKLALGIKVTDCHGQRVRFGQATGRNLGKVFSFLLLGIGYLMVAFTEKKQALHDIWSDCLVLKKPRHDQIQKNEPE